MGASLKLVATPIPDVVVVESISKIDHRGSFARLFCLSELSSIMRDRQIAQINQSQTTRAGTVRGIHYQLPPNSEMKLVRCTKGRVWDVAVDLRAGSRTLFKWHAQELSADNHLMMIVPEGFGHAFQALEPDSEVIYFNTAF